MIRSFLPVGQGAFYCEQFGDADERINVIYDCGSLPSKEQAERQIRNTFDKNETIHAVFISHMDADHINGIPYLLKYCKVKNIFFPLITDKNKIYMRLYNRIENEEKEKFVVSFITNPEETIKNMDLEEAHKPSLHPVQEWNEENVIENENNNQMQIDNTLRSGTNVAEKILDKSKEWEYIPFNFRQNERLNELKKALETEFGRRIDENELEEIWCRSEDDSKKIKRAYKQVRGGLNTNSMTLFSGMSKEGLVQYIMNEKYCYCHNCKNCCGCNSKEGGCLYTGDYTAAEAECWNRLKRAYQKYWKKIGCIQIPHHGSKSSYNSELGGFSAYYIISAGHHNRYQHPHARVIKDLLFQGHYPYIVTEDSVSAVHLRVDI